VREELFGLEMISVLGEDGVQECGLGGVSRVVRLGGWRERPVEHGVPAELVAVLAVLGLIAAGGGEDPGRHLIV
jgi:hypothetical protein